MSSVLLDEEILGYFPDGEIIPDVIGLVEANFEFRDREETQHHPQSPSVVAGSCGRFALEEVHHVRKLGWLFDPSSLRGIGASDVSVASFAYPFLNLKNPDGSPTADVCQFTAHDCVLQQACRVQSGFQRIDPDWETGLKFWDIKGSESIGQGTKIYARDNAASLISYETRIHDLIREGKLVIALSHYNNVTGEVTYAGIITSQREGLYSREMIQLACEGKDLSKIYEINSSLKNIHILKVGNEEHRARVAEKGKKHVKYLIHGCADSRTAPSIIFEAAAWEIESLRVAGNVVDENVMSSICLSIGEALKHGDHVTFVEKSHTDCGAIKGTVKAHHGAQIDSNLSPLIDCIGPRIRASQFYVDHPNWEDTDPYLVSAAKDNAIGAAYEIMNHNSKYGEKIRGWMRQGKLSIVPAVYYLKSGKTLFYTPLRLS